MAGTRKISFDGKDYEFPVDATDSEIADALNSVSPQNISTQSAEQAPMQPAAQNSEVNKNGSFTENLANVARHSFDPLGAGAAIRAATPDAVDNITRALGLTARHGVNSVMALPNMIGNAANATVNLGIKGINELGADIPYLMKPSDATEALLDKAGVPKPETPLERIVGSASEFVGAVPGFGAAGNLAAKYSPRVFKGLEALGQNYAQQAVGALTGGGAYGVSKEVAPDSPVVQIASTILGGAAGLKGLSSLTSELGARSNAAIPTTAELKKMGRELYKIVDDADVILKPEPLQRLGQSVVNDLAKYGYHPKLQPRIVPVLEELERVSRDNITAKGVQTLRRIVKNAAKSQDPTEKLFGQKIIEKIDDMMGNLLPDDVVQGDSNLVAAATREANKVWSQFRKSEMIDKAVRRGSNRAISSGSGGNEENAIRQNIRSILDDPKKMAGFTKKEEKLIETVVRGTKKQNLLRLGGKFSPTAGALPAAFAAVAGVGGSPLALLSGAGLLSKMASESIARKNIKALSELIRNVEVSPLPSKSSPPKFSPSVGEDQRLIEILRPRIDGPSGFLPSLYGKSRE